MSSADPNTPSPDEARISAALANDRPTIDAAAKAFLSLVCARGMSSSMTDQDIQSRVLLGVVSSATDTVLPTTNSPQQKQQALEVARAILQACNAHEFPIHKTVAAEMLKKPELSEDKKENILELSVVARLWNGLVQSKQKPTRFLGRKALLHAWSDLDVTSRLSIPKDGDEAGQSIYAQQLMWIKEFEQHLFYEKDPRNTTENDDSALIWAADGGNAELARRRERRKAAAKSANQSHRLSQINWEKMK